jgi:hypothetical protein
MKKFIDNNYLYIVGALVGAVAGWMYWKYIGCSSGTCMITSNPRNSTVYFAMIGALFFGIFKRDKKRSN